MYDGEERACWKQLPLRVLSENQVMKSQGIFVFIDQFGDQAVSHITKLLL